MKSVVGEKELSMTFYMEFVGSNVGIKNENQDVEHKFLLLKKAYQEQRCWKNSKDLDFVVHGGCCGMGKKLY